MNDLIDQIHYEHISMSKVLGIMENEIQQILTGGDPDFDLLVDGMRYMVDYSDTVHHPKEDVIFDRLSQSDEPLRKLIAELKQQHGLLGEMGSKLFNELKNAALGEFVAKDQISKDGKEYIKSLRHHMNLEEGQLLREARKLLSDKDMAEIAMQYEAYRDPLLSESLEQEYTGLYRSLTD